MTRKVRVVWIIFDSDVIDVANEPWKHINGIKGRSFVEWLRPRLTDAGYEIGDPEPESWGWHVQVRRGTGRYAIGISAIPDRSGIFDWSIRVWRERSVLDWITRQGMISRDDPLVRDLERLIRAECRPHELYFEERPGVPLEDWNR